MELHQLRYFVAAAEAGSISRAADRCHVAQPSLSQQIRKLEDSLGTRLFDRLGRGIALTDAGRALLPRARTILAEVEDARSNLRADMDRGVGRLVVGAIPTMAPYLLPGVIADLRTEFPDCELVVREDLTERLVEAIVDNELDAAVVSTPIDDDLVELEVVGEESMLVVSSASTPAIEGAEITLDDLRAVPRVSLHEMHCLGQQITGFCSMHRIGANIVCRTTQLATLLELVRLGLGVSIVPEMAARHDASPDRRYARFKRTGPRREIAIARRTGRTPSRTAQRFAELIAAAIPSGKP